MDTNSERVLVIAYRTNQKSPSPGGRGGRGRGSTPTLPSPIEGEGICLYCVLLLKGLVLSTKLE